MDSKKEVKRNKQAINETKTKESNNQQQNKFKNTISLHDAHLPAQSHCGRGDTNNQLLMEEKNKTKKHESLASKDCMIAHLSPE